MIDRLTANLELMDLLTKLVERYPTMRLSQILVNWHFVPSDGEDYFVEPDALLKRVQKRMVDLETAIL
jgi:hypothetical protein